MAKSFTEIKIHQLTDHSYKAQLDMKLLKPFSDSWGSPVRQYTAYEEIL